MIDIEDIAHALSMQCRWNGHCSQFVSVAEHSVAVSTIVESENQLQALLHDASEAYISDIPSPVKQYLDNYYTIESKIQQAILETFKCEPVLTEDVKDADAIQLKTEAKYLLPSGGKDWAGNFPTSNRKGKVPLCLAPGPARELFLNTFYELTEGRRPSKSPSLILVN